MSYKINTRIFETKPSDYFILVEKGVWNFANGGTWTVCEEQHLLKMGGSGTSGTLRFEKAGGGVYFTVALGVHNYKPWVDVLVDQLSEDTCVYIHPLFYKEGTAEAGVREQQLTKVQKKDKQGISVTAEVVKSGDHEYWVDIIIA
uniref:Isolectin 2a n=1 Tax=Hericium erinaceus TaxID=91752 RepID=A0A346RAL2_HERER|nr:isolectin 2a [Hericium erinaceus]